MQMNANLFQLHVLKDKFRFKKENLKFAENSSKNYRSYLLLIYMDILSINDKVYF